MRRGQALLETALCLPILLVLMLGAAAAVRAADARSGLDAAAAAGASAAARAPNAGLAPAAASAAFLAVAARYPLQSPGLVLGGGFARGQDLTVTATATVDLSFAPLPGVAGHLPLVATAHGRVEDWRGRR